MNGHPAGEDVEHKCQKTIAAVKGKIASGSCCKGQEGKCNGSARGVKTLLVAPQINCQAIGH